MNHILCHFEIPADDPAALAAFYRELFGWTIEPMGGHDGYWGISTGPEPAIGGGMMARQHPQHQPTNYILVEDVDAYLAKAVALGATALMPRTEIPGIGAFALIADPSGNCLGLFQPS